MSVATTRAFIPYGRQLIEDDDVAAVVETLKSDWLTQGPKIAEFESAVAARAGAKHGVAVATGTAALHCACFAAGVREGDEIITTPITFAASGNAALFLGATVKFIDIRADTYCMDPRLLEKAITRKTKAIIPVDYTGQPCDIEEINAIAKRHGLVVIQDAAHSLGATYKGRPVGSLADMTIFSFHPVKLITTAEGGMVVTDSRELDARLRLFRTHGMTTDENLIGGIPQAADNEGPCDTNPTGRAGWYYDMLALGYNFRITDMQCALGLSQLRKLDRFIARRRQIAALYDAAFSRSELLVVPRQEADRASAWHLYMLRLKLDRLKKSRRRIFEELRAAGIGVHVHYIPMHLLQYYRGRFGHKRGDFPISEAYYDSALTLPIFPAMTDEQVRTVIDAVLGIVS